MDRRDFIKTTSVVAGAYAIAEPSLLANLRSQGDESWFNRPMRWAQLTLVENDPGRFDPDFWLSYFKRIHADGTTLSAGGVVAYYPTDVPLHHRSDWLGNSDPFGYLVEGSRKMEMSIIARTDPHAARQNIYDTHPDWFAIDAAGKPYKAGDLFITCVNSPYYNQHIPAILSEIAKLYHPEGFTDNSWSGLGRDTICHCENCKKSFREKTGNEIPGARNWDDTVYRDWIRWNYNRRLEIWDLNNRITKSAGGPDCIWSGMNSGSISGQSRSFRDLKEICRRADIIMLDSQARSDAGGFQQNADTGKLIHGLLGWDKLVPESMAMYQAGRPTFRLAGKPVPEARMWMVEGMAGGIQPWWHYVGASHEDRRIYHTAGPIFRWHKANEEFLVNRDPVATVGVVWSQQNMDFYGRDEAELMVELPWRGITQALIRARIPYLPVHADHIDRDAEHLSLLVLPDLGVMTDDQVASVRHFVEGGGGLIATGESSLYNEWGDRRSDYALGDLFGAHTEEKRQTNSGATLRKWAGETYHTYLRLTPELRRNVDGPQTGMEPPVSGERHPVLKGFDETDILSFGGLLVPVRTDSGADVLMTFIPQFPIYPPETAWMREPKTDIPGLILNTISGGGRIAYMPADLDRQFGRYNLPDHGNLLANLIRWAAKDDIPLAVECAGMFDCNIYHQPGRLILHMVNLTSTGTWRQPVDEFIPVGPVKVRIKMPEDIRGRSLQLLVSDQKMSTAMEKGWIHFTINSISDHEVAVII